MWELLRSDIALRVDGPVEPDDQDKVAQPSSTPGQPPLIRQRAVHRRPVLMCVPEPPKKDCLTPTALHKKTTFCTVFPKFSPKIATGELQDPQNQVQQT